MSRTWALGLVMAVAIAGCTMVGPEYHRPEVAPPGQFRAQVAPAEASSLADLPWWQVFNDKALQGLIAEALSGNYDLKVAVARIEQARAQVAVVRADLYPQVGYQANAAREKSFIPLPQLQGNVTYNSFQAALNAAWELDVWGRIRRSAQAANAGLYAQEDVRRGVMLTLVSDLAANYFLLIELDRQMAIAQESVTVYKQTLDLFNQRFQAGLDSKLGVVRAQAAYESSNAAVAALNRAIPQQENAICVLLGSYPRAIERGTRLEQQTMPATPAGLSSDLLQRRPDIMQAEQVMIGANAEIGVAVANYFPRIGLSALYGGQGVAVEDLFKSNFSIWSVAAGLTGPIFQGGRLRANVQAQQAFWDESIAQYKQTVTVAFRETSDALIAQQTLLTQRSALESQVQANREAVDLAMQRYTGGRASYFEVLDAEQSLFPSENALAQAERDQLVAVVSLYKALGGGWNLKDEDWAQPH
ncbi:MAG TPA: efflux transporter outer membrane subunit [Steroidobacteraceae bacterium]|nr:efflux transporter outer membrane subunit [Steroidobacteraceae bacterium]HUI60676.1 efflux transporter outer membrane subunit [Steroidobacteraceae bacterium]